MPPLYHAGLPRTGRTTNNANEVGGGGQRGSAAVTSAQHAAAGSAAAGQALVGARAPTRGANDTYTRTHTNTRQVQKAQVGGGTRGLPVAHSTGRPRGANQGEEREGERE